MFYAQQPRPALNYNASVFFDGKLSTTRNEALAGSQSQFSSPHTLLSTFKLLWQPLQELTQPLHSSGTRHLRAMNVHAVAMWVCPHEHAGTWGYILKELIEIFVGW